MGQREVLTVHTFFRPVMLESHYDLITGILVNNNLS